VYAVHFVVPDQMEEEHHFNSLAGAAQAYQKLCDRREHGLIVLWRFDQDTGEWLFERGRCHFFTGKPGFYELQEAPGIAPPIHPQALEELIETKFDGGHHFGPDQ
jgi:hypothetical protein